MTDQIKPPKSLSLRPAQMPTDIVVAMTETELITEEQAKALAVANDAMRSMRKVSVPVATRHFGKIHQMLSVSKPTAVSRVLETLGELDEVMAELKPDFHKYKQLHFRAKYLRARLKGLEEQVAACEDQTQKDILQARYYLQLAEVEAIEAEVAEGHEKLKNLIEEATAQGERYQAILKESGRKEFTEKDFIDEELEHHLKSAFWHAGQVFVVKEEVIASTPFGEEKVSFVKLQKEVLVYFEGLGISPRELDQEFIELDDMRRNFDMVNPMVMGGGPQSFRPYFESWLDKMSRKYLQRIRDVVAQGGIKRLRRIVTMITPTDEDQGLGGPGTEVERQSIFE